MNDIIDEIIPPGPPETPKKRRWRVRVARWMLFFGLLPLLLIGGIAFLLDTQPGHRFIIDRIEEQNPKSGLKIKVGRIDGSIYGRATIRDLQLGDPEGIFFTANEAKLDWNPVRFVFQNTLDIDDLWVAKADLLRMPALIPDDEKKSILPGFNIRLGHYKVDRLVLNESIAGRFYAVGLDGKADVRGGRADVNLAIQSLDTKDNARIALIAVPDENIFDIDASLSAPDNGILAGMTGIKKPIGLALKGNGSWSKWTGALSAKTDKQELASLFLTATEGRYTAKGKIHPEYVVAPGMIQRITRGGVDVDINTLYKDNVVDGRFAFKSAALSATATGVASLKDRRFVGMNIDSRVIRPQALMTSMKGRDLRATLRLDGPFMAPRYNYRITSPRMEFGRNILNTVDIRGTGNWSAGTIQSIPMRASVASITGNGEMADALTRNVTVDGTFRLRGNELSSNLMQVRTSRINGQMVVNADLSSGRYNVGFDGRLPGYEIPGLGRVDIVSKLKVSPLDSGINVAGNAVAQVTRLDNSFFKTLAGGNPRLTTDLVMTPDGRLALNRLRITSPLLTATANGYRRPDGTFHFTGTGTHRQYGPLKITLDGDITRPKVDLFLARPMDAAGLADVEVHLLPNAQGYRYTAQGQSRLGPFTSNGAILLPANGDTVIDIAALTVAETTASGKLRPVTGGMAGTLAITGGGLDGTLDLGVRGGVQEVVMDLTAKDVNFPGPPPVRIGEGTIRGTARLLDNGPVIVGQVDLTRVEGFGYKARHLKADIRDLRGLGDMTKLTIDATVDAEGVEGSGIRFSTIKGEVKMVDGVGGATGQFVGVGPRGISFSGNAQFSPNAIRVTGSGTLAGRPVTFKYPLLLEREGAGWRLAATEILYGGGSIRVAGLFGGEATEVDAALKNMPLSLLDAINPTLQLGGIANGVVQYRAPARGAPTGQVELRVTNLTRSGLALASKPVDAAINAVLDSDSASMRGVIVSDGQTIGRIQAKATPLGGSNNLMERLMNAPLFAQARYNGAADTLWRLTGVEAVDLSGPVAIAADVSGTLANPDIDGAVRAKNARLENAVTGTVVTNVSTVGRFNGSKLELREFSGETKDGGKVTGSGTFELSAERGFAMNLNIDAEKALLIDRDDMTAVVTGPVHMQSDASGGIIEGNLILNEGSFVLGQATAAEALPVINVREINKPGEEGFDDQQLALTPTMPWRFDITAKADDGLRVTGMGLNSIWAADLLISGTVTEPRILGSATLMRGDYQFAGRLFELEKGDITFTGTVPADPILDITAVSDVSGLNATISIAGTGQKPEITFSSVPALPEDELLSRILFGESITNISVTEAAQLGVAVASLRGGGGLDPINALRDAIGLDRLRILSPDELTGRKTAIAAGKYITRKLYVEVITDGQGYSATQTEFAITRWLSILGSVSTIGRHSINLKAEKDY